MSPYSLQHAFMPARSNAPQERPVNLRTLQVRGVLNGRTQLRQPVRGVPPDTYRAVPSLLAHKGDLWDFRRHGNVPMAIRLPWKRGVRLWVKEPWDYFGGNEYIYQQERGSVLYQADDRPLRETRRWRPSIHMQRWASRILLEVTEVCVQRLQKITEEEARADIAGAPFDTARESFAPRWDALYGKRRARENVVLGDPGYRVQRPWRYVVDTSASWASNPWVQATTFRRIA